MTDCPRMKAKLQLIYAAGLNPNITSHSALARELGVSRQSISQWLNGTNRHRTDAVPHAKLVLIAAFFCLEPHWFTGSVEEFEYRLRRHRDARRVQLGQRAQARHLSALVREPSPLIGRASALAALNFAWSNTSIHALSLEGCGGSGKTAVISGWLQELSGRHYLGAERVFVWDFDATANDSAAVSEERFLSALCTFLGIETEFHKHSSERLRRLGEYFSRVAILLVLDGLDRLLPAGAASDELEAPTLNALINKLLTFNLGLLVATTRTPLGIFSLAQREVMRRISLGNLSREEALLLLKSRGAIGDSRIQGEVVEQTAGHALSLCCAADMLKSYREETGFFFSLDRLLSVVAGSEDSFSPLYCVEARLSLLSRRYSDQEGAELLTLLSLLDASVTVAELEGLVAALAAVGQLSVLTPALLPRLISRLSRDNLLSAGVEAVDDFGHSLVTSDLAFVGVRDGGVRPRRPILLQPFLRVRLSSAIKVDDEKSFQRWHRHIARYFSREGSASHSGGAALSVLRSVRHSVAGGLLAEGFRGFFFELPRGARHSGTDFRQHERETLAVFFAQSWMAPNPLFEERERQQLQVAVAHNLMALGFTMESTLVARHCIDFLLRSGQGYAALRVAGPLATQFFATGQLHQVEGLMEDLFAWLDLHEAQLLDPALESSLYSFKATIAFVRGKYEEAENHFAASERLLHGICTQPPKFATLSAYYCRFLIFTGRAELAIERGLETLAWRQQRSWQTRVDAPVLLARDLMMIGLGYVAIGDLNAAEGYINEQLSVLRTGNEWLHLPMGLNARAQFYFAAGDHAAAIADLHEGLALTEDSRASVSRWELLLSFAEHHAHAENYDYARAFLEQARAIEGLEDFRFYDARIERIEALISLGAGSD